MSDITIVTAFFDIKRGSMNSYKRNNQQYIEYFKFWAHIHNKIVIYSDKDTIDKVSEIRKEYGLLDKTISVVIEDYSAIDRELYESICNVMNNPDFLNFHVQRNIPEAISPQYNYIMALKSWCCADASQKKYATDIVAWVDFGFNYGGKYYKNEEEFDFLWDYEFTRKIHLVKIHDFDDMLPFEMIRQNNTYIQGGCLIAPVELWPHMWKMVRNNMLALNVSGLCDDDQLLYLLCYKQKPEIFELHDSNVWLSLFTLFGGKEFTFSVPRESKMRLFFRRIKHPMSNDAIRKIIYSIRTFVYLIKCKQRT